MSQENEAEEPKLTTKTVKFRGQTCGVSFVEYETLIQVLVSGKREAYSSYGPNTSSKKKKACLIRLLKAAT